MSDEEQRFTVREVIDALVAAGFGRTRRGSNDASDDYERGLAAGIAQERGRCARVLEALKPFADRGRAKFTTGDYNNPEPAPDKQIFGSEVLLSVGELRRAREAYDAAIRAGEGK